LVPFKVTVPLFALKLPALDQLPDTFILPLGAVKLLDTAMSRLSKVLVLPPLIAVVPSNVTVPLFAVKVPALTQLPPTFMFTAGAVRLLDEVISTLLKELMLLPLIAVFPSKVTVPLFALKVPELAQLPETFNALVGAVKVPEEILTLVVLTVPPAPVNVPPLTVNPPLKSWVLLEP